MKWFLIIFLIIVGIYLFDHEFQLTDDLIFWIKFSWIKAKENVFLLLGLACLPLAIFVLFIFKPHPGEKYFLAYKDGKMERDEAVQKMARTIYNWRTTGLPAAWKSKITAKRTDALSERVRAEHGFLKELIRYMRTKDMF